MTALAVWAGGIALLVLASIIADAWWDYNVLKATDGFAVVPILGWPFVVAALLVVAPFYGLHAGTKTLRKARDRRVRHRRAPTADPYQQTAEAEVESLLRERSDALNHPSQGKG